MRRIAVIATACVASIGAGIGIAVADSPTTQNVGSPRPVQIVKYEWRLNFSTPVPAVALTLGIPSGYIDPQYEVEDSQGSSFLNINGDVPCPRGLFPLQAYGHGGQLGTTALGSGGSDYSSEIANAVYPSGDGSGGARVDFMGTTSDPGGTPDGFRVDHYLYTVTSVPESVALTYYVACG